MYEIWQKKNATECLVRIKWTKVFNILKEELEQGEIFKQELTNNSGIDLLQMIMFMCGKR